jgi:hypothetical protein
MDLVRHLSENHLGSTGSNSPSMLTAKAINICFSSYGSESCVDPVIGLSEIKESGVWNIRLRRYWERKAREYQWSETTEMKLTEVNPGYIDRLHRLLARDKQTLQRFGRVKPGIPLVRVFKDHRKRRATNGAVKEVTVGFAVRRC